MIELLTLVAVVVLGAALLVQRRSPDNPETSPIARETPLFVEPVPGTTQVALLDRMGGEQLLRVEPDDGRAAVALTADGWMQATLISLIQQSPQLLKHFGRSHPTQAGTYLVTFPKDVQRALANGTARLMTAQDGRTLAKAVSVKTGKVIGSATVVKGAAAATPAAVPVLPVLAVAAVAVGAVYLMQRDLKKTIKVVEGRVLAVLERIDDDDYGRLEAALLAAGQAEELLREGVELPDHYRLQLAMSSRDADAIYLSRHRFLKRFEASHERVYAALSAETEDLTKLPKDLAAAIGDPDRFQREAALYVAALVTRARVQATTAALLAMEGHAELSLRRSQEIAAGLHQDAKECQRRMRALSTRQTSRRHRDIVAMAKELTDALDEAVRTLPNRELADVTVRLEIPPGLAAEATS